MFWRQYISSRFSPIKESLILGRIGCLCNDLDCLEQLIPLYPEGKIPEMANSLKDRSKAVEDWLNDGLEAGIINTREYDFLYLNICLSSYRGGD